MEIAIGKEKLSIGWRHLGIFIFSYWVVLVVVTVMLSAIIGVTFNQDILLVNFEITRYFAEYPILIFNIACSFFALEVAKYLKYNFKEKDLVSLAASSFLVGLFLSFVTVILAAAVNLPKAELNSASSLIAFSFTTVISYLWGSLLLCIFLIVLYRNKTIFASELIFASLAVGVLPIFVNLLTTSLEIGGLAKLPASFDFSVFVNGALLGFFAMNYIIQQRGKLSQYIYGITVLYLLADLSSSLVENTVFNTLVFGLQLFLIYVFGKIFSEKYKK